MPTANTAESSILNIASNLPYFVSLCELPWDGKMQQIYEIAWQTKQMYHNMNPKGFKFQIFMKIFREYTGNIKTIPRLTSQP